MTWRTLTFIAAGLSCLLIVASLTLLASQYPENIIVLGVGVVTLSSALVVLQLSFWREGEANNREDVTGAVHAVTQRAPVELRNPQLRRVWENMEVSRRLMADKEKEARETELRDEKKRLGLSRDETILLMEELSWVAFWPIVVLSAGLLLSSTLLTASTLSFLCLALGLGGLLLLTALRGQTRYYLTNFRVLVRRRPVMGRRTRWSSLPYSEVRKCMLGRGFGRGSLTLEGSGETVGIRGLSDAHFFAVTEILRKKLPTVSGL
jgi:hypothetical protein